MQFSRIPALR
uniref:Uncharacterized protein n=1 Tax=Rhizophora mucronata TaxID=61149 RepID=A0A2P2MZ51_RHIMU